MLVDVIQRKPNPVSTAATLQLAGAMLTLIVNPNDYTESINVNELVPLAVRLLVAVHSVSKTNLSQVHFRSWT